MRERPSIAAGTSTTSYELRATRRLSAHGVGEGRPGVLVEHHRHLQRRLLSEPGAAWMCIRVLDREPASALCLLVRLRLRLLVLLVLLDDRPRRPLELSARRVLPEHHKHALRQLRPELRRPGRILDPGS